MFDQNEVLKTISVVNKTVKENNIMDENLYHLIIVVYKNVNKLIEKNKEIKVDYKIN